MLAAKIADSLAVLPTVRREAAAWQQSSSFYRQAADSFRVADATHYHAFQQVRGALQDERLLAANETAKAEAWRKTARRRGFFNYLLLAVAGGTGYFFLKP